MLKERVLVSLDGECPYYCKHCYTYSLEKKHEIRNINEIVESLHDKKFDVVYVSQRRENFVDPDEGLELCEALYERYHTDLVAITRSVFNEAQLERASKLNEQMKKEGKEIFLAVSVPAMKSANITEDLSLIPSPDERIRFLNRASERGISTLLVIRPLYPRTIIPMSEICELIDKCKSFVKCVLSSGLAVNEKILNQLGFGEKDFLYVDDEKSEYLVGTIDDVKYINVEHELNDIGQYCNKINVPFFKHSMPAINHIKNSKNI